MTRLLFQMTGLKPGDLIHDGFMIGKEISLRGCQAEHYRIVNHPELQLRVDECSDTAHIFSTIVHANIQSIPLTRQWNDFVTKKILVTSTYNLTIAEHRNQIKQLENKIDYCKDVARIQVEKVRKEMFPDS